MKPLIYTIAYGDEFWECARVMVASLRTWGMYDGDVVVYSDHDGSIEGARVMRDTTPLAFPHIFMAKAFLGRILPAGYDRVLYLDADIAVINPVSPLLRDQPFSLPPECIHNFQPNKHWFSMPGEVLPPDSCGYNAGTISCNATVFHRLCHRWWDFMLERKSWELPGGIDQQPLNYLARSGEFPFTPFPTDWFFFFNDPSDYRSITRSTIICHPKQQKQSHQQMFLNMRGLWG